MTEWPGWTFDRGVLAFTAVLYLGIWMQLTLMHWAGGFKHRAMWAPVLVTPLLVGATVAGVISRSGAFGWIVAGVLAVGVVQGLTGVALHVRGVVSQIGGLSLRNLLSGPPPILPLAYALVGVLGVGAVVWNG